MTWPCPSCTYANEMRYTVALLPVRVLVLQICELKCDVRLCSAVKCAMCDAARPLSVGPVVAEPYQAYAGQSYIPPQPQQQVRTKQATTHTSTQHTTKQQHTTQHDTSSTSITTTQTSINTHDNCAGKTTAVWLCCTSIANPTASTTTTTAASLCSCACVLLCSMWLIVVLVVFCWFCRAVVKLFVLLRFLVSDFQLGKCTNARRLFNTQQRSNTTHPLNL